MAVVESLLIFERTAERAENSFRGECRGERQVAAGESLGQTQEIRYDVFLLACKHRSRSPEAGHHLIQNQKNIYVVAELS